MPKPSTLAFIATALAILITTTMDFTGYTVFSALPLIVLILLFWTILRLTKKEIGLAWGGLRYYGYALLYPLLVLGAATLIAFFYEGFHITDIDAKKDIGNLIAGLIIGPIMLVLTEEGFFRGWLWGAFRKAGYSQNKTLLTTTGLFVLWHISAVVSGTEYGLPMTQVPVYLTNAFLLGLIWGLLRQASGSVLVPAVCHAVWNAFAYGLFGYGEKSGMLGLTQNVVLGPEVGFLGILLNGLFAFWLWKKIGTNA